MVYTDSLLLKNIVIGLYYRLSFDLWGAYFTHLLTLYQGQSEEIAEIVKILVPVLVSFIVTVLLVIG